MPKRDILDGRSFAPLLKNPDKEWPYPSITTQAAGSFTVNDENWRYTKYNDGTEELYDLKNDPMEWTNLIRLKDKKHWKLRQDWKNGCRKPVLLIFLLIGVVKAIWKLPEEKNQIVPLTNSGL